MFGRADLVFLHAPSVYDFRKHSILYGPVSDLVPSTPVFEMYPIGFTTMAEYLNATACACASSTWPCACSTTKRSTPSR